MVVSVTDLNRKECELIPGVKVSAYTDIKLDPDNPTGIILDTTWDEVKLDLASVVKAGETITRLYLAPETGDPLGLCYEKEDGTTDYISGDELSRIISMQYLKDVDQETTPTDGIVYQYNGNTNLFEPFNLKTFVQTTNTTLNQLSSRITELHTLLSALTSRVTSLEGRMTTVEGDVSNLKSRMTTAEGNITNLGNRMTTAEGKITTIEAKLTPPSDAPNNVKVTFGNINLYSDHTNSNLKTSGLYTHTLSTDVTNDEKFA